MQVQLASHSDLTKNKQISKYRAQAANLLISHWHTKDKQELDFLTSWIDQSGYNSIKMQSNMIKLAIVALKFLFIMLSSGNQLF